MTCVRITRVHHPLQGHSLEVLGQMHCRGRLELLLVLPDGSKSLVPAAWTDYAADTPHGAGTVAAQCEVLAAPEDLMAARVVVSALLAPTISVPEQAARQFPSKEDHRAARPTQSAPQPLPAPSIQLIGQLPPQQVQEALAQLARLIAKMTTAHREETDDE
jgi:hypothetical protein